MAVIAPFRGIFYNTEKVGDYSRVIAPPYDVISPEGQDRLYGKSDYNIVRIDFGKELPGDTETNNRYSRAAADFASWQASGVLLRDEEPSVYAYEQDYRLKDGSIKTRKGFLSLVKLEDFDSGVILPHERTLSGPKTDRLNLTRASSANFSPIFSLYSDHAMKTNKILARVTASQPFINITGEDGIAHKLWKVSDKDSISGLVAEMADKMIFIADGHHRYETALNYRDEVRKAHPEFTGREGYNYTLMYFSNMDDKGLTVFPTHRLMYGLKGFNPEAFEKRLADDFHIEKMAVKDDTAGLRERLREKGEKGHSIGVYAGGDQGCIITLKNEDVMDALVPDHSRAYRRLDVTILHTLIIERVLGISRESQERKENIEYIQDEDEGLRRVKTEDRQLLFILNPTKVHEVEEVARAKDKMPQKSTYFYPKLATGLVINRVDEVQI